MNALLVILNFKVSFLWHTFVKLRISCNLGAGCVIPKVPLGTLRGMLGVRRKNLRGASRASCWTEHLGPLALVSPGGRDKQQAWFSLSTTVNKGNLLNCQIGHVNWN